MTTTDRLAEALKASIHHIEYDPDGALSKQCNEALAAYESEQKQEATCDIFDNTWRIKAIEEIGLQHSIENGFHVIRGIGFEYKHTSLMCAMSRIGHAFADYKAALTTDHSNVSEDVRESVEWAEKERRKYEMNGGGYDEVIHLDNLIRAATTRTSAS